MDAVHHLMYFALNLMTSGRIDDVVDAEYINSLEWYHSLPEILAGEVDKDDGVAARGEGHLHFPPMIFRGAHIQQRIYNT